MVAGRVVRFDGVKGYGFIAPEGGGEDVFLHVNDLLIPSSSVRSGAMVEFEIEQGDRGLKAASVRLPEGLVSTAILSKTAAAQPVGEDSLCDLLSPAEFLNEVTETLLAAVPSLTGEQILQIRAQLLKFGKGHGWTDG